MAVTACRAVPGAHKSMPIPGLDTEFDVHYNIRTNSILDDAATIYASAVLPARYTSHPNNVFATVRTISLEMDPKTRSEDRLWRAVVHYSSAPLTKKEEEQSVTPLDREAKIRWESVAYQVPVLFGIRDGKQVAIVNSAADTPDPVPEMTEFFWVANVSKNVASPPSWVMDDYVGSVNAAEFEIDGLPVLAECARMTALSVSEKLKEGTVNYRTLSFSLEFRGRRDVRQLVDGTDNPDDEPPPPFDLELADMGLHDIDGKKLMTNDDPPRPVAQAVPLDGAGAKLVDPTPYNTVFFSWRIHKTKDWSVLPLT